MINEKHTYPCNLDYEIVKCIVDEAMLIYLQTHKISPDFCVCRFSLEQVIFSVIDHLENETELKYLAISFKNFMTLTQVYVNAQYIVNQFNKSRL